MRTERDPMDRDAAMEKIRKCLALSSSPNENEARTALLMARRLMAEYKIGSTEDISAEEEPEKRQTSITYTTIRDNWVIDLLNVMGPRFCCRPFSSRMYGKKTRTASFLGFPQDLDVCIPAFELAVNVIRSNSVRMKLSRESSDSYARGFIKGLMHEYARQDAEAAASQCTERSLVTVMSVPEEVNKYAERNFSTESIKVRSYGLNERAFTSGYYDGKSHLVRRVDGADVRQLR